MRGGPQLIADAPLNILKSISNPRWVTDFFISTILPIQDMMFYMKKNKEKDAVKAKERQQRDELKNVVITDTAENSIRKEQFSRDQDWKAAQRDTKTNLKDVNMAVASFEGEVRKEQHEREKGYKAAQRDTKTNLKDVNMAVASFEGEIRKEHHEREKDWKDTQRTTKKDLADVNMAAAVFN